MGSSGKPISIFQRKLQNDFQSGSNSLQYHKQWQSVPLSPHLQQHLLSPVVLHVGILIGVKRNPGVILICISLITKDFDHSFIFKTVIHL